MIGKSELIDIDDFDGGSDDTAGEPSVLCRHCDHFGPPMWAVRAGGPAKIFRTCFNCKGAL